MSLCLQAETLLPLPSFNPFGSARCAVRNIMLQPICSASLRFSPSSQRSQLNPKDG